MAYLIELLFPLADSEAEASHSALAEQLKQRLTDVFGGVTVYSRASAEGLWAKGAEVVKDRIVLFEVMAETVDRAWWAELRRSLEQDLLQDEVVIRWHEIGRL